MIAGDERQAFVIGKLMKKRQHLERGGNVRSRRFGVPTCSPFGLIADEGVRVPARKRAAIFYFFAFSICFMSRAAWLRAMSGRRSSSVSS